MTYNVNKIGKEQESIAIKIWTETDSLEIVNYYNPCNRLTPEILNAASGPVHGRVVWCRDFNSPSSLWGSSNTDANGAVMEEFMDEKHLV